jgi:sulfoxide reductase heme-binding subunit YedZ
VANTLGANPAEALIRGTGDWTLRLLCLTLAVTPLRQCHRLAALARLRRMLGLFTFFYGVLHFLCFAWLDMGLDLGAILEGHPQAPLHPGGHGGAAADAAAGRHLVQPRDQGAWAPRWQALHRMRLRRRAAGAAALLLDARGQERLCRVVGLRRILACCWAGG